MEPIKLGVNIDHAATLRQARGVDYPDLAAIAALAEKAGAHGITIHLREDRRHIQDADVYRLRKTLTTRMNLEMANNPDVVRVALDVVPDEVCLVPERRQELTTEGGLDAAGQLLTEIGADNRYARLLAEMSSTVPEPMNEAVRRFRGDFALPPFIAMSYNASITEAVALLDIGSRSATVLR